MKINFIPLGQAFSLSSIDLMCLTLILSPGMYNTTQLVLSWEKRSPVVVNSHLQMTEYNLVAMWTNVSDVVYSIPEQATSDFDNIHLYGKFGKSEFRIFCLLLLGQFLIFSQAVEGNAKLF